MNWESMTAARPNSKLISAGCLCSVILCFVVLRSFAPGAEDVDVDAAGHYMATLLVADYLAGGQFGDPVGHVVEYFTHYPMGKIAQSPPLAYGLFALGTFAFGDDRATMIIGIKAIACLTAGLGGFILWRLTRNWASFLFGGLFGGLPLVISTSQTFLMDIPVALFSLAAIFAFARYAQSGRDVDALLFGVFSALTLLVKANGMFLALVPIFYLLFTFEFWRLKTKNFWLPVPIVIVFGTPYYFVLMILGRLGDGTRAIRSPDYFIDSFLFYLKTVASNLGYVGFLFAVIGGIKGIIALRGGKTSPGAAIRVVLLSAGCAAIVFQSFMPTTRLDRYMMVAISPWLVLALAGVFDALELWAVRSEKTKAC